MANTFFFPDTESEWTMSNDFPELSDFLAAYFYPYWRDEYDWNGEESSFEAVARHYKIENAPHIVRQTTKELQQFLDLPLSDSELYEKSRYFFHYYQGDGLSRREVLENILKVLKDPNSAKPLKRIR